MEPKINCLIKATCSTPCVLAPEYVYLPVGLNHLIYRTLLFPLNLLSQLVRQFISVENNSAQVGASRVIRFLTVSAHRAADG